MRLALAVVLALSATASAPGASDVPWKRGGLAHGIALPGETVTLATAPLFTYTGIDVTYELASGPPLRGWVVRSIEACSAVGCRPWQEVARAAATPSGEAFLSAFADCPSGCWHERLQFENAGDLVEYHAVWRSHPR